MKLLVPKARAALERYGHQIVVGNELHRRKYEVVFVARTAQEARGGGQKASVSFEEKWLRISEDLSLAGKEIEEDIIAELVREHATWVADAPS